EQYSSLNFRYVIIGTERNTILNLYDVETAEHIQSIKFLPPYECRPSVSKAYRKEELMFNYVSFDQNTHTLIVANSARVSIFALHLNIPNKNLDKFDLFNPNNLAVSGKIEHESTSTSEYSSTTNSVQFDYMIEFPIDQLIGSFVMVPGATPSDGFSLYCSQQKSVRQYTISRDILLPQNIDVCPEYVCAERVLDHQQQETKDDVKEESKNNHVETDEILSQVENLNQSSVEETIIERAMESLIAEGDVSDANIVNPESDETTLEKGNIIFKNMQDSTFVIEENMSKSAENQKPQKSKSAGHSNGTTSKAKAPKKQGAEVLSDSEKTNNKKTRNENFIHSSEASNKSTGKKNAE
ncbi:16444_t:CDS:1, partial [Acaulospora morrowiae]